MSTSGNVNVGLTAHVTENVGVRAQAIAAETTGLITRELIEEEVAEQTADEEPADDESDDVGDGLRDEEVANDELDDELRDEDLSGHLADVNEGAQAEEPPAREDIADSDEWLLDGDSQSPWELEWRGRCPLIADLPRRARPTVRFAIDNNFNVSMLEVSQIPGLLHHLHRTDLRRVEEHLKQHGIHMRESADWCYLVVFGGEEGLLRTIAANAESSKLDELLDLRRASRKNCSDKVKKELENYLQAFGNNFLDFYRALDSCGGMLRHFAVRLANTKARLRVAHAVASHLKLHCVQLHTPGEWVIIPAIGSDAELLRLAVDDIDRAWIDDLVHLRGASKKKSDTKQHAQEALREHLRNFSHEFQYFYRALDKCGTMLKDMAVRLANGDVVKMAALMDSARRGKRATRAAAFRLERGRPEAVAGQPWVDPDWKGFAESQRKKKYRKQKSSRKAKSNESTND